MNSFLAFVKGLFFTLLDVLFALTKLVAIATLAAFITIGYIMYDQGNIRIPSPSRPLPSQMAPIAVSPSLDVRTSTIAASTPETRIDAMRRATVLVHVGRGQGSGVVIDNQQCLVVTNHHVINSPGDITVSFVVGYRHDGSPIVISSSAELAAYPDLTDDLALLRMSYCTGVSWAPLADSDTVKPLDPVFAVGSPHGLSWTFTQGVVSHAQRAVFDAARGSGELLIQTDAAINPGNSGGPLFNTRGEVIGINSLKYRDADNLGFAHPSNAVRVYLAHVAKYAYLPRHELGIEDARTQSNSDALVARVPRVMYLQGFFGVKVVTVQAGSIAEAAGLQADDVILVATDTGIYSYEQLRRLVYANGAGAFNVSVWRNNERVNLTLMLPEPETGRAPWAAPLVPSDADVPPPPPIQM